MSKYDQIEAPHGEWSAKINPKTDGYRLACCDCGLVHDMEFRATTVLNVNPDGTEDYVELDPQKHGVVFRVRRNVRSTAMIRRHRKAKSQRTNL